MAIGVPVVKKRYRLVVWKKGVDGVQLGNLLAFRNSLCRLVFGALRPSACIGNPIEQHPPRKGKDGQYFIPPLN